EAELAQDLGHRLGRILCHASILDGARRLSTAGLQLRFRLPRYASRVARILVVEDERTLAHAIKRGLEDELHAVDVEHDGESALLACRNAPYDLVVLDLMLPKLSGHDVCRRLRAAKNDVAIL